MKSLFEELANACRGDVLKDEPMERHTTFRVGGPADMMVVPEDRNDLKKCLRILEARKVRPVLIGKGSNLIVSDSGIRGVVIKIAGNMAAIKINKNVVTAQAGVFMKTLIFGCGKAGLSGLEALIGIPAALGGALSMNMSAWGTSISSLVKNVSVMGIDGKVRKIPNDKCGFAYRNSDLTKENRVVIAAELELKDDDPLKISERQDAILKLKSSVQPVGSFSAGCIFKNPGIETAGKLIEKAGLKGEAIGGAVVSRVHANYIINEGGASAAEVMRLIEKIRGIVMDKFNIRLELEVKTLGF